jgi:hypothetical protein
MRNWRLVITIHKQLLCAVDRRQRGVSDVETWKREDREKAAQCSALYVVLSMTLNFLSLGGVPEMLRVPLNGQGGSSKMQAPLGQWLLAPLHCPPFPAPSGICVWVEPCLAVVAHIVPHA